MTRLDELLGRTESESNKLRIERLLAETTGKHAVVFCPYAVGLEDSLEAVLGRIGTHLESYDKNCRTEVTVDCHAREGKGYRFHILTWGRPF